MKWCEIFKTGRHTDSKGNERTWIISDLQQIERNFRNVNSDVPICCGHVKTNSPAYGWIDDLKIVGGSLYASYKDVQKEFKEAVNKGLFKTRSISLTPDLMIRHIAFLGGQTPAIKGLEQFCFADCENEILINFEANMNDDISSAVLAADPIGEEGASSPILTNIGESSVNEENLQKELEQKNVEISEKDKEIQYLKEKVEKQEQEKLNKEFQDFCDSAIAEGHILPAQKQEIINIMEACNAYEPFEFADDNGKLKTETAINLFKNFVSGLKQMDFEEVATQNNVDTSKNSIDFQDVESIKVGILNVQNEYKQKGIDLTPDKALQILKKKEK